MNNQVSAPTLEFRLRPEFEALVLTRAEVHLLILLQDEVSRSELLICQNMGIVKPTLRQYLSALRNKIFPLGFGVAWVGKKGNISYQLFRICKGPNLSQYPADSKLD